MTCLIHFLCFVTRWIEWNRRTTGVIGAFRRSKARYFERNDSLLRFYDELIFSDLITSF